MKGNFWPEEKQGMSPPASESKPLNYMPPSPQPPGRDIHIDTFNGIDYGFQRMGNLK